MYNKSLTMKILNDMIPLLYILSPEASDGQLRVAI